MPDQTHDMPARLVLEDGTVFHGRARGATQDESGGARGGRGGTTAEVVFNTAMTGYQEALTDPSYAGQILVMTAPLIGNTGINVEDDESDRVQVAGFVVREFARVHSNYRASESLDDYLRRNNILAMDHVDTRAITRRIRETGAMRGSLSADQRLTDTQLRDAAREAPLMEGQNLVKDVALSDAATWNTSLGRWAPANTPHAEDGPNVLAIDCGAKHNILRHLVQRGCNVTRLPADADLLQAIKELAPDGLFVSNGPGDPAAVERTVAGLREALKRDLPVFGICLGHQLTCLALGATTYKLKFGHRGINQPVLNRRSGRVEITSQNHGFAVDRASLEQVGASVTHVHLNDDTVAGFCLDNGRVMAVQYHPEASPGPHDASYLFDAFVAMMRDPSLTAANALGLDHTPHHISR